MEAQKPEILEEQASLETPEDVAVLYSWANLQGAKYRDFSASRRETRAQLRHRAAQAQTEAELRAKAEAEAAAAQNERAAREAEEAARFHEDQARKAAELRRRQDSEQEEAARERAMRNAEELSRRAAAERMEAARRAEALRTAEAAARREARELAEARASAQRQAARYEESEIRRRSLAGPQPSAVLGGHVTDPYQDLPQAMPGRLFHQPTLSDEDMMPSRHSLTRDTRSIVPQSELEEAYVTRAPYDPARMPLEPAPRVPDPQLYYDPNPRERAAAVDQYVQYIQYGVEPTQPAAPEPDRTPAYGGYEQDRPRGYQPDEPSQIHPRYTAPEPDVPAWINNPALSASAPLQQTYAPSREPGRPLPRTSPVADTLQHSRERVAARWYALKGVFDHGAAEPEVPQPRQGKEPRVPLLAIFSMAGGVGKTSLTAALGRALSSHGENVLLTDTTSHGLLPFYFGASELRPGIVRTFSPPSGSADAPIYLVSYDVTQTVGDVVAQDQLSEDMIRNTRGVQRVIVDLTPNAQWLTRRLARMDALILVPVAPDMNSVISLGPIEKYFSDMSDSTGHMIQPLYLLNQFDASLPLHLDVREVLRQQLGDRLLPVTIRRAPAVSEALAEGMTVVDYAPESGVASDYANLAAWLRAHSAPATTGFKNARWSER